MWIEQYDLNIGVRGGPQDSLEDVRDHFDDLLADAVERDPNLGDGVDADTPGVQ